MSDNFIEPSQKRKKETEEKAAALLAAYRNKVITSRKKPTQISQSPFFGVSKNHSCV